MTITTAATTTPQTEEQRALEQFPLDVKNHVMTIVTDCAAGTDQPVRHLRFAQPNGSPFMAFQITTWANHIALSGDMGTLLINNHDVDMLPWASSKRRVKPSLDYWCSKVVASDPNHSLFEFGEHLLNQQVRECVFQDLLVASVDDWMEEHYAPFVNDENSARDWLSENAEIVGDDAVWEWDFPQISYRPVWQMLAIRWGVNLYLASKD